MNLIKKLLLVSVLLINTTYAQDVFNLQAQYLEYAKKGNFKPAWYDLENAIVSTVDIQQLKDASYSAKDGQKGSITLTLKKSITDFAITFNIVYADSNPTIIIKSSNNQEVGIKLSNSTLYIQGKKLELGVGSRGSLQTITIRKVGPEIGLVFNGDKKLYVDIEDFKDLKEIYIPLQNERLYGLKITENKE